MLPKCGGPDPVGEGNALSPAWLGFYEELARLLDNLDMRRAAPKACHLINPPPLNKRPAANKKRPPLTRSIGGGRLWRHKRAY